MSDVIDIGEQRKKRQKKDPANVKLSLVELCDMFTECINHGKHNPLGVTFPERFYTYSLGQGMRIIVRIDERNVAHIVSDMEFVNDVSRFAREDIRGLPELMLTTGKANEVMEFWRAVTQPIPPMPYTRWLSEEGTAWERLPFDLTPDPKEELVPTWSRLLSRIDSSKACDALCAWIGSLFFADSYRQQYVWIYGGGGNGKGAIARFLYRVFGNTGAHYISYIPEKPNQFWTSQLLTRRLVIIPDCEQYHFPATGLFKTLSGGDPICIEPKQKPAFTTTLDCKFLFTSNQLPALSSEKSDMRRPIFVRLDANGSWEKDFEDNLWAEGGAFLWHCVTKYHEMCPTHGPIPVDHDASELTNWVSTLEEPFEEIFNEWFKLSPDEHTLPADMQRILKHVYGTKRGPQLEFLKWLDRNHGVRKKSVRLGGVATIKAYSGLITIKSTSSVHMGQSWCGREDDL